VTPREPIDAAPQEMRLTLPGTPLAARCWGERPGHPVLALHGWLDNAASFDLLAPALCADAALPPLQFVALDLPGHGFSAWRPPGGHYGIVDYAADVLAVADALGWARFTIIGHSLGAGIATLVGGAVPERLSAAVLIDGLGPLASPAGDAPSMLARALDQATTSPSCPPRALPDLNAAIEVRRRSRFSIGHDAARLLCERGTRTTAGGERVWRADPRLRHPSAARLTEASVCAFIEAMTVPTLLIEAEQGALRSRAAAPFADRLTRHPALCRVVVPGNHHPHLDGHADVVAAHCARFLREQLDG
jgi:pimeloyl-ACP methyl ester carboxylesterase